MYYKTPVRGLERGLTSVWNRVSVLSIQCIKVVDEEEEYIESGQALYILPAGPSTPARGGYTRQRHLEEGFYELIVSIRIHLHRKEGLV